ncbi:putative Na(+)/H(+) antiporter GerT [Ceratocystis fimbriata CBS 114723]|uniref:Putative Na(+)/H(+) antiporter GerT n=1 Tax=Ceratocystis fimbriata CBS 114723 TaxID=1035309 RepID=A0A2C5XHF1_9PEZI|nr:putative Na(+)/H(+) antiporter GerT [Ceratocystis fimbriata CBS 114723]
MSSTGTTATHSTIATAALPYHEPTIATVLTQASLLLALNALNSVFDKLAYCGLLGQIALGITWGTPGVKWLDDTIEATIVQLGYLGLILMVYEGGLSTSLSALKANFWLSLGVAFTGIALPISFSFALKTLLNATSLQCFAAGAALCSTSLGTTFTLLRSSGLAHTRLGVILTSAAMLDDVIGLVMVQVISSLGQSSSPGAGLSVSDVLRPVLVSIGFAVLAPAVCIWAVKPLTIRIDSYRQKQNTPLLIKETLGGREAAVIIHTLVLLGLVAGAGYAGFNWILDTYNGDVFWNCEKPDAIVVDANAQASSPSQAGNPSQKDQSGVAAHTGEEQEISREGSEMSERDGPSHRHTSPAGQRPLSLYPASLIGCGMVARGEIGFLISSLAESQGIFESSNTDDPDESQSSSQIFLVVTWAVVLCTIVGPLAVGLLAQRLRRLQEGLRDVDENSGDGSVAVQADGRQQNGVLGVWGLET